MEHDPDDIQPVGTYKGILNKPTYMTVNLVKLFLADSNFNVLNSSLYAVYKQNGGRIEFSKFSKFMLTLQKKFVAENRLSEYQVADYQATYNTNYVDILQAINNDFQKMVYKYFKWNVFNPFHDDIEVSDGNTKYLKKSADIEPEEFGLLDVWRNQITLVANRNFRNDNKIPAHRASIQTRHYFRGNEGLAENNPNRSSLETFVSGYDMSRVHKTVLNYKQDSWFGI